MASPQVEALPFSDHLLAEILIRLPTLEDVGRASASCPAFHRVITSHSFLRRLHALHPPSILGFHTYSGMFHPVEPPHPSAPASRALAEAADFEFSFLPGKGFWMVRDARGSRFLLDCDEGTDATFTTIAVCDPLFRRYVLLPPLPEDLAAAVELEQPLRVNAERRCDVFFAPCGEEAEAGGAPEAFSVICMVPCPTKLVAFIFSSVTGQWRAIASSSWHDLNPAMPPDLQHSPLRWRSYAYGCFYWFLEGINSFFLEGMNSRNKLLVLDMDRMAFYPVNLPSGYWLREFAIVELGERRRGMFMLNYSNYNEDSLMLFFSASNQIHGEGASEWVLENTIPFSRLYSINILGVADGKLLLQGTSQGSSASEYGCVSLDLKTFEFRKLRGMMHRGSCPMLARYIGYPPSLSLPTI